MLRYYELWEALATKYRFNIIIHTVKMVLTRNDTGLDCFVLVFKCSVSCGPGRRTRVATCISQSACDPEQKPTTQETCDMGPCLSKPLIANAVSTRFQSPQWLYTEWSEGVGRFYFLFNFSAFLGSNETHYVSTISDFTVSLYSLRM